MFQPLRGRHARAKNRLPSQCLQSGEREAESIDPTDPGVLYNVACSYVLGGMHDKALDCLERAVANGFGHREWLDNDSDLDPLRDSPRFKALRAKI